MLCVVEPMSTGVGGDCFALIWRDGELTGLNASGRAPAAPTPTRMGTASRCTARCSVTVPGAVAAGPRSPSATASSASIAACGRDRHRRARLRRHARDRGHVGELAAGNLARFDEARRAFLRHRASARSRGCPSSRARCGGSPRRGRTASTAARSARRSARSRRSRRRPRAAARRLGRAAAGALPRRRGVRDPAQRPGRRRRCRRSASRRARPHRRLALDRVHLQAEAMKLAFADAERYVHDGPLPAGYLDDDYLAERRARSTRRGRRAGGGCAAAGGTVYLCAVDDERNACSLIQSVYYGFGSLVVAPGTGVALQNRGHCFTLEAGHPNRLAPGQAPVPHDHPGHAAARRRPARAVRRDGRPHAAAGPPAGRLAPASTAGSIRRPRSTSRAGASTGRARRVGARARGAAATGLAGGARAPRPPRACAIPTPVGFGGGQAILVDGDVLIGGSEPRKDGFALGSLGIGGRPCSDRRLGPRPGGMLLTWL